MRGIRTASDRLGSSAPGPPSGGRQACCSSDETARSSAIPTSKSRRLALAAPLRADAADLHCGRGARSPAPGTGVSAAVLERCAPPRILRRARLHRRSGDMRRRLFARLAALRSRHADAPRIDAAANPRADETLLRSSQRQWGRKADRVAFPMLFYPADEIRSRLAGGVEPRLWTIEVSAPAVRPRGQRSSTLMDRWRSPSC